MSKIQQIAIINLSLSLIELKLIKTFQVSFKQHKIELLTKQSKKLVDYLNNATDQLYQVGFIKDKPIPIEYISNIEPVQMTVSVNYQFDMTKLKSFQNILFKNDFKVRFVYV